MKEKPIQGIFFRDFKNAYIPHIMKEMWIDRVYDSYFEGKSNLTILDVGANVGLFSYYAYPFAKRIFALEPSSEHFETLNTMVKYNNLEKVIPIKQALSNENGKATFYHNPNVTMYSLRQEVQGQDQETEEVDTITIDRFMDQNGIDEIDFLKLDVEGSELDILSHPSFEAVAPKIKAIYGEFHVWSGRNPEQLKTMLIDYGYKFERIPTEAFVFAAYR